MIPACFLVNLRKAKRDLVEPKIRKGSSSSTRERHLSSTPLAGETEAKSSKDLPAQRGSVICLPRFLLGKATDKNWQMRVHGTREEVYFHSPDQVKGLMSLLTPLRNL
jgi:hypothetical protein